MIDKKELVRLICNKLEADLAGLRSAALDTYAAATGEESQPENQYDTRALEASYLAGAQSKRLLEVEASLAIFKKFEVRSFKESDEIGSSALAELELHNKKTKVFIVPSAGGMVIRSDAAAAENTIHLVTPKSPLGEALVGLRVGDIATLDRGAEQLEYEVLSIE